MYVSLCIFGCIFAPALARWGIFLFDNAPGRGYNILNKRAVDWMKPSRQQEALLKVAPYLTRARALLFAYKKHNKSYDSAKHNYKLE